MGRHRELVGTRGRQIELQQRPDDFEEHRAARLDEDEHVAGGDWPAARPERALLDDPAPDLAGNVFGQLALRDFLRLWRLQRPVIGIRIVAFLLHLGP